MRGALTNYRKITDYYVSEFERYTLALEAGTLPPGMAVDRIDPRCRVMLSDLSARFPGVDWIEAQPWIDRAVRRLKRKGLWK